MKYTLTLLFCIPAFLFCKQVEIVPSCEAELELRFLSREDQKDQRHSGWYRGWSHFASYIKENGGSISFTDMSDVPKKKGRLDRYLFKQYKKNVDLLIAWGLPGFFHSRKFYNIPKKKQVIFLFEPPTVVPTQYEDKVKKYFSRVYTWCDDLVDNKQFFKFYYPVLRSPVDSKIPFQAKKLCCMITANKSSYHPDELYSKRRAIINFYEGKEGFDLFGFSWTEADSSHYQGIVDDKIAKASEYKFAFCLENMGNINGYITEKIFDAFASLTVPIYEGASNITDEIPANCFIDLREFNSFDDLHAKLTTMSQEEYNQYIKNIRTYLKSEKAQRFSVERFGALAERL